MPSTTSTKTTILWDQDSYTDMDESAQDVNDLLSELCSFFDTYGPESGNPLIARGLSQRWNAISSGYDTAPDLWTLISQLCGNDTEIVKIYDADDSLFLVGSHHDGSIEVEIRQFDYDSLLRWKDIDTTDFATDQDECNTRNAVWDNLAKASFCTHYFTATHAITQP